MYPTAAGEVGPCVSAGDGPGAKTSLLQQQCKEQGAVSASPLPCGAMSPIWTQHHPKAPAWASCIPGVMLSMATPRFLRTRNPASGLPAPFKPPGIQDATNLSLCVDGWWDRGCRARPEPCTMRFSTQSHGSQPGLCLPAPWPL